VGSYSFPKEEKIRRRADFQRTFQKGAKRKTEHFRIYICPTPLPHSRLGISVSKRVGGAVIRNRLKRLIREFFRLSKDLFPGSSDVVIVPQPGAAGLNFWKLAEELKRIFREQ
jgi:ribonuclease P protein component